MFGSHAEQMSMHLRSLFKAGILAAVYYAVGTLSLSLGLVSSAEVLVWPPVGIGLAALLLNGLWLWPGIVVGAFLLSIRAGVPASAALGTALAIAGESLLSAYVLQRWMGFHNSLARLRDVGALLGLAGLVSPATGSLAGALSWCLVRPFPWSEFGRVWLLWWRAEAIATLVVAPAFLTWGSNLHLKWISRKRGEALVLTTWLLLGNLLVFSSWSPIANLHFPTGTLPFALRLWAAFRFGPRGATAANTLVVLIAARGTLGGFGPLVGETVLQSLVFLGAYAISTSAVSIFVAAVINERKQIEEELRISEDRYRDLVEQSEDLICTHDLEGRILSVNDASARILGYEPSELLKKNIRDVLAPDVQDQFADYLAIVKRDGVAKGFMLVVTKHGEWRIWEYHNILRIAGVASPIVRGMAHDITERKRTERALRESQEKFSKAFHSNPIAMAITTLDEGRILDVNHNFEQQLGYKREEVVGKTASELGIWLEPAARTSVRAEWQEPGSVRNVEARCRTRSGEQRLMMFSAEVIELGGEKCVLSVAEDVTERKHAEQKLKEQTTYLSALIGGSPIAIVAYDSQGRIKMCNPAFEHLFQYQQSEIVGAQLDELVATEELSAEAVGITKRTVAGKTAHITNRRRRKDGSLVDVEIIGIPLLVGGQLLGGYGLYQDITERKQLETQLRQAQKMEAIGRLAGGVAHDFNNLLVGILGYGSKLHEELAPDDPLRRRTKQIVQSGLRARELVRQLLIFSRKHPIETQILNLNDAIRELEDTLRRLIGEDIELVTDLDPHLGAVKADLGGLTQIMMNLAANARDAMPNGGKLTIQTANFELIERDSQQLPDLELGRYVVLTVSDTGCGMDEATQAHIFEPFFTTKTPSLGTGLGLASVYANVKQSGGRITFSSQPGRGTTFRLSFAQVCKAKEMGAPVHAELTCASGSETILVVEDNEMVGNLVCEVLEAKGYTVILARDGQEALFLAEQNVRGPIRLLLTDVVMPGMSGRELAESLQRTNPRLKVLYMTGYADDRLVPHGIKDEGIGILQKPFLEHELVGRVRKILDGQSEEEVAPLQIPNCKT